MKLQHFIQYSCYKVYVTQFEPYALRNFICFKVYVIQIEYTKGARLGALLETLCTLFLECYMGFRGSLNWATKMPRGINCTSYRCINCTRGTKFCSCETHDKNTTKLYSYVMLGKNTTKSTVEILILNLGS